MSEHPNVDIEALSASELAEYIELNAAADADAAVNEMLLKIREQQANARAAVHAADNNPAKLAQARELIQQSRDAADWMTASADTWTRVYKNAFSRGALWMLRQIPRR